MRHKDTTQQHFIPTSIMQDMAESACTFQSSTSSAPLLVNWCDELVGTICTYCWIESILQLLSNVPALAFWAQTWRNRESTMEALKEWCNDNNEKILALGPSILPQALALALALSCDGLYRPLQELKRRI